MNKRTKINIAEPDFKIKLKDNIFSVGSCFSNETAKYLKQNGLFCLSNPFGTIYNSYSIFKVFERIFSKYNYTKNDLFNENSLFFSLEHSTKFDSHDMENTLNSINKNIDDSFKYIQNTNIYIITLGTSVIYEYKKTIAANCHKLANDLFTKRILDVSENTELLKKTKALIFKNNPKAKIIITLSPVRHTPSNLAENSYSKSILRTAIGKATDNISTFYFPSYEIVIDELRDYSNYKKDMLHLKKRSVQYVMDIFKNTFFDKDLAAFITEYNSYSRLRNHKVKDTGTELHFGVLKKELEKISELYIQKHSAILENDLFVISKDLVTYFHNKKQTRELFDKYLNEMPDLKDLFSTALSIKINNIKIEENEFLKTTDSRKIAKYKIKLLKEYYLNNNEKDKFFRIMKKS